VGIWLERARGVKRGELCRHKRGRLPDGREARGVLCVGVDDHFAAGRKEAAQSGLQKEREESEGRSAKRKKKKEEKEIAIGWQEWTHREKEEAGDWAICLKSEDHAHRGPKRRGKKKDAGKEEDLDDET